MYDDIDYKIKWLATLIFCLSIIFGGLMVLLSLANKEYIGIIYSIVIIISGTILSYFTYGFGEIIKYLKGIYNNIVSTSLNNQDKQEIIKASNSRLDILKVANSDGERWKCKKCESFNPNTQNFCKDCGEYR